MIASDHDHRRADRWGAGGARAAAPGGRAAVGALAERSRDDPLPVRPPRPARHPGDARRAALVGAPGAGRPAAGRVRHRGGRRGHGHRQRPPAAVGVGPGAVLDPDRRGRPPRVGAGHRGDGARLPLRVRAARPARDRPRRRRSATWPRCGRTCGWASSPAAATRCGCGPRGCATRRPAAPRGARSARRPAPTGRRTRSSAGSGGCPRAARSRAPPSRPPGSWRRSA